MAKLKVTKSTLEKVLSKELKEQFEIDNTKIISTKFVDPKFGLIDFKQMSVSKANYLVKKGCPFISLKTVSK